MKTTKRGSKFQFLLASAFLAVPSAAVLAATVTNNQVKGSTAYATWQQSDGVCASSTTEILALNQVYKSPGDSTSVSIVYFDSNAYNYCTGVVTFFLYGSTSNMQLRATQNNSSATLTGTIPVSVCSLDPTTSNYSCSGHSAVVNLSWAATSNPTSGHTVSVFRTGPSMIVTRLFGTVASATASGSISLEDGTPLIPGDSQYGSFGNSNSGSLEIFH
jgi:hypothetical protein